MQRRDFLTLASLLPLMPFAAGASASNPLFTKAIPSSGELIPAIGMGSARTFDIDPSSAEMVNLLEVLKTFFLMGGTVLDSSPMYGNAEIVLGRLLAQIQPQPKIFAASKVWTEGKQQGIAAIEESRRRFGVEQFDLMQVHNLKDWKTQIATLFEMKQQGRLKYVGISTSGKRQYADIASVMKNYPIDFVQLNYNILVRDAEAELLPLAQERGIAVMVNRPYQKGALFKKVKGKSLPEWSKDFGCSSWGQFFLKYIISHPAVTVAIPATTKVKHMKDNMGALLGELPNNSQRKQMEAYFNSI
ncbi:MAG: aldo/keto reductase [Kangiellaceae bacterium]|jgi:diketogulonate reductase-like aldo/keto reductase|nr:aldo/keto reductase [Kangiellaceae bacterium]